MEYLTNGQIFLSDETAEKIAPSIIKLITNKNQNTAYNSCLFLLTLGSGRLPKQKFPKETIETIGKMLIDDKEEVREATSFVINYQENEREEGLDVEGEDEDGKKYSFSVVKERLVPDIKPYQLNIFYKNNRDEERLDISYSIRDYPAEREEALQDFTNRADKSLHIMPQSIMGGILGLTYLGENFMARRDDLVGDMAKMVDVHEAIHTPDEYETRVLTDWMLTREMPKYKR